MPDEHRTLATALQLEETLTGQDKTLPKELKAMSYTCLAHDWYDIDLEEEGNRLLLKAEAICPGYFKETINQQTAANPNFAFLVERLTNKIVALLAASLKAK